MSNKFGDNLRWFLGELANAEVEQIETGEIEIYGEDEQGREGSCNIEVLELVGAAVELIDRQAAQLGEFKKLVDMDGGSAIDKLIELVEDLNKYLTL